MSMRARMLARSEGGDLERTFLGFVVGDVTYAVDIQNVREIIKPLPTLALPHVPDPVVGVVDHRGNVVPIVDLRLRFGIEPSGADPHSMRWVIMSRRGQLVGLVVDRVTEVFGVPPDSRRDVPKIVDAARARDIVGAISLRGQLVFLLDGSALAEAADEVDLSAAERVVAAGEPE